MELTKKMLEDVKFRTRGKWYDGVQVDAFLDQMIVAADFSQRELQEAREYAKGLAKQVETLREENKALWEQVRALESGRDETEEKRRERDGLLRDIKALRAFRETFRHSVEQDAASLTEQVKGLGSDKLL